MDPEECEQTLSPQNKEGNTVEVSLPHESSRSFLYPCNSYRRCHKDSRDDVQNIINVGDKIDECCISLQLF